MPESDEREDGEEEDAEEWDPPPETLVAGGTFSSAHADPATSVTATATTTRALIGVLRVRCRRRPRSPTPSTRRWCKRRAAARASVTLRNDRRLIILPPGRGELHGRALSRGQDTARHLR